MINGELLDGLLTEHHLEVVGISLSRIILGVISSLKVKVVMEFWLKVLVVQVGPRVIQAI